ncbi:MAG: hypothetical protein HMLKMBBP_01851 [Planctomycetes bacterium]|nr:hypothetical protein [Planctomycetota bacterium]
MSCKRVPVLFLALAAAAALAPGCAGASSRRVDPRADDDLGGTMIDSSDVIAVTDRAAADLSQYLLASQRNDLVVAVATIRNESVQPINTALLTDRMRDQLVQTTSPRVRYRATEHLDDVLKERDGKRTGALSSSGAKKNVVGADALLSGRISSLSKKYEGDRADYFQLGFQLVDAEDGTILFSRQYEFKKIGDSGVIYQ